MTDAARPAAARSARHGRPRRGAAVLLVLLSVVSLLLSSCASGAGAGMPSGPYSSKPNIVFVLTDDLDSGLVQYMPHVIALEQMGMTFTNYTVTDSLCCPSRASIFTGQFPHDTHVFSNDPPDGGFGAFYARGEENHTFASALQAAGYRTGMMGKYLNGYAVGVNPYDYPTDYVPPGWSTWDVASNGYGEFNYNLNSDHRLLQYGHSPADYLTGVLSSKGREFIRSAAEARQPFFLEAATFSPHWPYVPAPVDRNAFAGLQEPRDSSFNHVPAHAPAWLANRKPLDARAIKKLNDIYVKRVEAVQSVDRMIGALEATLRATGQLSNTVFVFSSDNGFHLGQHGLTAGKLTAFDTDVRVPLVVAGPGVPAGTTNPSVTENVDLAPTFEQLAGAAMSPRQDGRSLVPLVHGRHPPWRTVALVEHHGPDTAPSDPDAQSFAAGNPPTYEAMRTARWTYVRYASGAREYYDRARDPNENDNIAGSLSAARTHQLDGMLKTLATCHGAASCWQAGRPTNEMPNP